MWQGIMRKEWVVKSFHYMIINLGSVYIILKSWMALLLGAFTKGAIKENNNFFGTKSLQPTLERNSSNFSYISFLDVNFKNLTIEFHVPYVFNMHIILTIRSIHLFFIHNFRSQKLKILTFV